MHVEEVREYCLSKPFCFECFPFDDTSLVFKVGVDNGKHAKMFALLPLDNPYYIALKCDPHEAERLRDLYPEITPAYHFNKKHWNSVRTDGRLDRELITGLIDHSYDLMFKSLSRKTKDALIGH